MKSDNSPAMIKGKLVAEWKCNKRVSSQYWQIEAPDRVTPMNITSVSPSPIHSKRTKASVFLYFSLLIIHLFKNFAQKSG